MEKILETYGVEGIVLAILITIMVVTYIIDQCGRIKQLFDAYHNKKKGIEDKEQTVEQRIEKLEEHDKWQYTELQKQSALMQDMISLLHDMQAENDKNIVATNRSTLNRIATEVLARGYMSITEYETFKELSDIYIAKGGNHSMKDKVIPAVLNLPIR